jgi:hypothetical protein
MDDIRSERRPMPHFSNPKNSKQNPPGRRKPTLDLAEVRGNFSFKRSVRLDYDLRRALTLPTRPISRIACDSFTLSAAIMALLGARVAAVMSSIQRHMIRALVSQQLSNDACVR